MTRFLVRVGNWIGDGSLFVGGVFIIATMFLLVGNALGRMVFGKPIFLTLDTAGLLASVAASAAMVFTTRQGANIAVELVVERLPRRVARGLAIFSDLLSVGAVGYLDWTLLGLVRNAMRTGEKTVIAGVPLAYFKVVFLLSMLVVGVWIILGLVKGVRKGGRM